MKLELTEKQLLRLYELEHFPSSRKIPPFGTEGFDFLTLNELNDMQLIIHSFVECELTSKGLTTLKYCLAASVLVDSQWRVIFDQRELKHTFNEILYLGPAQDKCPDDQTIRDSMKAISQVATTTFVVLPREAMDFYLKDSAPLSERALAIRDTFQTLVKL